MSNVESAEGWNYIQAGGKGWVEAEWAGNMQEALMRVRELAERFNKEHLVSPFPAMAQEILKALDGEQE